MTKPIDDTKTPPVWISRSDLGDRDRERYESGRAVGFAEGIEAAAHECETHATLWVGQTTTLLRVQAQRIRELAPGDVVGVDRQVLVKVREALAYARKHPAWRDRTDGAEMVDAALAALGGG